MGKTRDLCKKIRDIKGTFLAKTDTIKDRNGVDLTDIKQNCIFIFCQPLLNKISVSILPVVLVIIEMTKSPPGLQRSC